MAKLGEDVLEWQTDQLVQWLQQEGMNDCIGPFTTRKINGRSLVNLSEFDIKSLHHVSHESKRKLMKSIEKYKRKKKEKMNAMFGRGQQQVQTVNTRKHLSFSQDEDAGSDDDGWGSEEWDSDGSRDDASSEGDYLEPEEDLSKTGSLGREAVNSVPTGLVAQLRAGIASSLSRSHPAAAPQQNYQDDEDIYDMPPEEDDEELYDQPSDNSGGAVVVRPPKKPPKLEERGEYIHPRGMEEDQDLYEAPLEEEEEPPRPPARPSKDHRFIPTKVAQGNKFVPVNNNENEMYDIPDLEEQEEEEDSYEIPGEQALPPRPPKPSSDPVRFSKPFTPQKPQVSPGKPSFKAPLPQPSSQPQGVPGRFPGLSARPPQSLSPQGTPFRSQPPPPTQTRFQPQLGRKPPPEQKKLEFPPKNTAPPPLNRGGLGRSPGGQERSPPASPMKSFGGNIAPGPGPRLRPTPGPRSGILNKMETPPRAAAMETPSPSPQGPPRPPANHRKQAPLPTERPPQPEPKPSPPVVPLSSRPSIPPPQKIEQVPPRPPKAGQLGGSQQPTLPPRHGERPGVPLPAPPTVPSFQRDLREQSSASSIESTSADEPIISLQHLTKTGKRDRQLPPPPSSEVKSPLQMMKDAPWYQGPVDRKAAEASLKQSNQNGAFLVRNSTKSPNDYSMSLIFNGNVRHLRIPHKNNKYVLGDSGTQEFNSIIDLVNHFRQSELDLKTGGKTKLTIACQVYQS